MENPLFAEEPSVVFRLKDNPIKMARSVKKVWKWIKILMASQAAAEHDDIDQVVVEMVEGREYRLQLTPSSGLFTIVVKGPGGWDPAVRDVRLLFTLRDLYLVGFLHHDGVWRLYDDACVIESLAKNADNGAYWRRLGFSGGYCEHMWAASVGMEPMFYALRTLSEYDGTTPASFAVRLALYHFIVGISEAIRFPMWMRYFLSLLRGFKSEPLKNPIYRFDLYFSDWSDMCEIVQKGQAVFVPWRGFNTYKDLIEKIFLLLST